MLNWHSWTFIAFSLSEVYDRKRTEHLAELQKKEEEMRQTFVIRVKETEGELKDAEKEVGTLTRLKWKKKKKNLYGHENFPTCFPWSRVDKSSTKAKCVPVKNVGRD